MLISGRYFTKKAKIQMKLSIFIIFIVANTTSGARQRNRRGLQMRTFRNFHSNLRDFQGSGKSIKPSVFDLKVTGICNSKMCKKCDSLWSRKRSVNELPIRQTCGVLMRLPNCCDQNIFSYGF